MPTVSSLPASLMRMALLPALILAATPAGAADSTSTERLDNAILSSHGALVETTADEATAGTQDSSQGDAASAQASRASTSSTGHDGADASLADPLPINRGGQPADARAELENQRRQAQAALNRRDPARALAMANAALREAPGDARLRFLKGLALFQLKATWRVPAMPWKPPSAPSRTTRWPTRIWAICTCSWRHSAGAMPRSWRPAPCAPPG